MARKSSAAEKLPEPKTVGERRRALRDEKTDATGPGVKKIVIDLDAPDARKALTSLYPRPEDETILTATPALEQAALAYIRSRDAATLAEQEKEKAGNRLCEAIRKHLGVAGDGWRATWDMVKGSVDWTKLSKEQGIADDVIARYRLPEKRSLRVTEKAEEG